MLGAIHPHTRARLVHLDALDGLVVGSQVYVPQKHRLLKHKHITSETGEPKLGVEG